MAATLPHRSFQCRLIVIFSSTFVDLMTLANCSHISEQINDATFNFIHQNWGYIIFSLQHTNLVTFGSAIIGSLLCSVCKLISQHRVLLGAHNSKKSHTIFENPSENPHCCHSVRVSLKGNAPHLSKWTDKYFHRVSDVVSNKRQSEA